MAGALTEAHRAPWSDDDHQTAAALLVKDLGEFAQAIVACAISNFWSPALAMQRLVIERTEVLLGTTFDRDIAKRYLTADAIDPEADRLKPKKRARPEDVAVQAREAFLKHLNLPGEVASFRAAIVVMKANASDWYIHPNSMGPQTSFRVQEGIDGPEDHWQAVLMLFAWACLVTLTAGSHLRVSVPAELVRAIDGAVEGIRQLGGEPEYLEDIVAIIKRRIMPADG